MAVERMRAVVAHGPGNVEVADVAVPEPGSDEALIRVQACGVCGTDVHVADGDYEPVTYPVILGHEFVGTVDRLGAGSVGLSVGDLVVVDQSLYCGTCEYCSTGRDNLCTSGGGLGTTADGAAAEYVTAPARLCYPVPDGLDPEHAALIEPLACAVHGFEMLPRRTGDHYLIYGAGTMGLLMTGLARASGAGSVSVVDVASERLGTAEKMGAHAVAESADALGRDTWNVVIDCTGARAAIEDAMTRLARGATYLQFGVASTETTVPLRPFQLFKEEITLTGSRAVLGNFPAALAIAASGSIDLGLLIGARLPIDRYPEALETIAGGGSGKILIDPTG